MSKGKPIKLPPRPPSQSSMYTVPARDRAFALALAFPLEWAPFEAAAQARGWHIGEVGGHGLRVGSVLEAVQQGESPTQVYEVMEKGSLVFRASQDRCWDRALLYRDCA